VTSYKEIIISSDSYKNKRGEAERVVFNNWISKELDIVFKNNIVPFHKPICEIVQERKNVKWNDLISILNKNQEDYLQFLKTLTIECPQCGAKIEKERNYNYTKVAGCKLYEYKKCSFGQTFYLDTTFFRLGLLERSLTLFECNNLLERIKNIGVNGIPDFVGTKSGRLNVIEVKDLNEHLAHEQLDWLNWFSQETSAEVILIRVYSGSPK
jgi:hypothetical protein